MITKDLELEITPPNSTEHMAFLYNAYDSYKADPKSKEETISKFVSLFLETSANLQSLATLDPTRIVPVIKDRPWLEEIQRALINRGAKQLKENVYEDFNDDLIILYAEDSPKNMRYFTPEDLEEAKIERKELRNLACENLKRLISKIERHGANGLYMITAGGDYEASLLLFDGIWDDLQKEVRGELVVAIPARDLLIVTGSEDEEGIKRMKQIVQEASAKGPYLLTPKLFVYRESKFEEFVSA